MSRQCVSKYTYFHVFHLGCFFSQVIQWATYHKDDPPPPEDDENKEKRTDDISSWDADFLKVIHYFGILSFLNIYTCIWEFSKPLILTTQFGLIIWTTFITIYLKKFGTP